MAGNSFQSPAPVSCWTRGGKLLKCYVENSAKTETETSERNKLCYSPEEDHLHTEQLICNLSMSNSIKGTGNSSQRSLFSPILIYPYLQDMMSPLSALLVSILRTCAVSIPSDIPRSRQQFPTSFFIFTMCCDVNRSFPSSPVDNVNVQ